MSQKAQVSIYNVIYRVIQKSDRTLNINNLETNKGKRMGFEHNEWKRTGNFMTKTQMSARIVPFFDCRWLINGLQVTRKLTTDQCAVRYSATQLSHKTQYRS